MTNYDLSENEWQVLEEIARIKPASPWGAWVSAVLGCLEGNGYIVSCFGGPLTAKGVAAIQSRYPEWTP